MTIKQKEQPLSGLESKEKEYSRVIALREEMYDRDVAANPEKESARGNQAQHELIVLSYADELIGENADLSPEDRVAARIATILHDSGKLNSVMLEHHIRGVEYAGIILDQMMGQAIEGVTIAENLKHKVQAAIERHMNHPYLVLGNDGKEFPVPETVVDRIVFDADMLANAGFKNVGFRLNNENDMANDAQAAGPDGCALEETFKNVLGFNRDLEDNKHISDPAKDKIGQLNGQSKKIFEYLRNNAIFRKIQEQFSDNGEFTTRTIAKRGGLATIKDKLNNEIKKAGATVGVDNKVTERFLM